VKTNLVDDIKRKQEAYGEKVVNSFSDSFHSVILTSRVLMAFATAAAAFIQERPLRGGHDDTPGVE
jgi:hypothetical protein